MQSQSRKAKGRKLQQWVAQRVQDWLGLAEDDVVSRSMGSGGCDLMLSSLAQKVFPFAVECKNQKTFSLFAALEQARYNAKNLTPCVCHKLHGKGFDKTMISFDLEEFLKAWKEKIGDQENNNS